MTSVAKDDLYIFSLGKEITSSLKLLHFDEYAAIVDPSSHDEVNNRLKEVSPNGDPKPKDYYKSDLHRLNLKRQVNKLPPLTEEEFEKLIESQSLESISGSEESEDEDEETQKMDTLFEKLSTSEAEDERNVSHMNTNSPYILFQSRLVDSGKAFGLYKALFTKSSLESGDVIPELNRIASEPVGSGISVLLMIGGGHFAGAVISHQRRNMKGLAPNHKISKQEQQVNVLQSKTFHRYTTRRKQGGSQSASDNARGKANSAGSSIRRYNEQALQQEVRELLASWKEYLDKADFVFIRANAVANRRALVGYEGAPLGNDDKRLRSFPFTTKRATLSELKRAWVRLSYMQVVELPKVTKKAPEKALEASRVQRKTPSPKPELSGSDKHTKELIDLLKKSRAPLMINYLKKHNLSADFEFTPANQHAYTPTPLHYASSQGLHHMVQVLLVNLKADPTKVNSVGKTACQMNSNSAVKKAFQIARHTLGEDFADWKAAKVGPPKSKEEFAQEEEQQKKQQEAENRRLIEEELAKKTEMELKKPTFSSGGTLGGKTVQSRLSETSELTEQQKTRLMREQRARAAEARIKKLQGK
ncbi:hypothetical protein CJJ07_002938 [Candidozyma auris]|nr:hypothetical protein CJJ07_002938 [[Candida] auris]QEL61613.1 hypothetical protein CJJ09_003761 [[Candida] auris]